MVKCRYPDPDIYTSLPDWADEWKTTDECQHESCTEADYYMRLYRRRSRPLTREEREEIESDRELMADEFHGRNLDGVVIW